MALHDGQMSKVDDIIEAVTHLSEAVKDLHQELGSTEDKVKALRSD